MRRAQLILVVLAALALPACISLTTVVKVNTDGSGTVAQTTLMSPQMIEMMAGFASMGDEKKSAAPPDLFPEKELRAKAEKMGPGVKFVSSRKIKNEDGQGVEAVYAFKDINTIKVEDKPDTPGMTSTSKPGSEGPQFKLARSAGGNAQLTVSFPKSDDAPPSNVAAKKDKPKEKGGGSSGKQPTAQEMEQAKQMLKGMRIGLYVEAGKSVVKTNSPFLQGNRVTLMELDFGALLTNDKKLKELMALKDQSSLESAKKILKDVPGIKVNLEPEVQIEFK